MNWGNKLLLAIVVFVAGISYLVYRATQTNFELVEKDYYKQEIGYQQRINSTSSAAPYADEILLNQKANAIELSLPSALADKISEGNVWFYCAYNSSLDKHFQLKTDLNFVQSFPLSMIQPGNYKVKIEWVANGQKYYIEKNFKITG